MKLTSLHVSNLLSFADFDLRLEDGVTVIVGPNGSGKTNVVRALDLVNKLAEWVDEQGFPARGAGTPAAVAAASYAQAAHDASPSGTPIEVRAGVEWTTSLERERIVAFVRAALVGTLAEETQPGDEIKKAKLSEWVIREVNCETLKSLFKGVLVFRHPGYATGLWEGRYQFDHDERHFDWALYGPNLWDSSVIPRGMQIDNVTPRTKLWEALFGEAPAPSPPTTLPEPLPDFGLKALCVPAGTALANLVIRLGTGAFNDQNEPFRAAANLLKIPAGQGGRQVFGLGRAISLCLGDGLVVLGETFRGLGVGGSVAWPAGVYPWELLGNDAPYDPGFLPLRLFQLKNGMTAEHRETFAAVQREFARLAPGRSFDITFTPAKTKVPMTTVVGAGQVAVPAGEAEDQPGSFISVVVWENVVKGQPRIERPVQLFGAGTWEALVLAEALVNSAGRFTVLDEPALNLHPTWQSVLRRALREAGGQFLLVTHSPSLVPAESSEDLRHIVRMSNEKGASNRYRLPAKLTPERGAKAIRALLSADARSLLFCRGAVVVSGETELGALPVWFVKSKAAEELGDPSRLDLAFFSVFGDGGFANILSVLHAFNVPWVLLCDGKSFDIETNWRCHVFRQITGAGIDIPELAGFTQRVNRGDKARRSMTEALWKEQLELGAQHGIFTLARDWKTGRQESIEGFFENVAPGKLKEAEAEVGDSKVRKGRWVAEKTPCPHEVDQLYRLVVAVVHG